jgi:diguanylate cyclase (GGDEF)-like protein
MTEPAEHQATHSLATRLSGFVACLVAVVVLVIASANMAAERMELLRGAERHAKDLSSLGAAMAAPDLHYRELRRLERLADSISAREGVDAVLIYDATGQLAASGGRALPGRIDAVTMATQSAQSGKPLIERIGGAVVSTHPVRWGENTEGALTVYIGASLVNHSILMSALRNLALCLLAILAGVIMARMMAERITKPLRELTDFARKVSVKRLAGTVDIRTGDEIETLGWALNRMLRRIDSSMNRIQRLAFVDPVTELPNRERFMRETEAALARLKDEVAVVALIDIERFRSINESLGPHRGDEALAAIGERLAFAARAADKVLRANFDQDAPSVIARLGADEFGLLIPSLTEKTHAAKFIQLVIASMRQPLLVAGHTLTLGAGAGVAIAPGDGETAQDLFKHADLALKEAKRSGTGRARFFTRAMNSAAQDRLKLETELRVAADRGEFIAFYQPKVELKTNKIVGVEALARWCKPSGEIIAPGRFIETAEEIGLIGMIGEAVLKDACRMGARWTKMGYPIQVAVNVSPKQFDDTRFADKVLEALRETGLPPSHLELEVTESMAVSKPEQVAEIMHPLRAMGVRLAIDDFGAGHSNLSTLTRLPFDVFKIDQQFVRALHSDPQAPAIIEMILAMAQALGLETVAEGIETTGQCDLLRRKNCTIGQGYLFSPPLPSAGLTDFLIEWNEGRLGKTRSDNAA